METQHREDQQQLQRVPPPNSWTPPHTPPHNMGGAAGVTELSSGGVVGTSPQRWSTSRTEGRGVPRKLVSYGRSSSTLPSILRSSSPLLGTPLNSSKKGGSKGAAEVCMPVSSLASSPARTKLAADVCATAGPVLSTQPCVGVVPSKSSSSVGLPSTACRASSVTRTVAAYRSASTANHHPTSTANHANHHPTSTANNHPIPTVNHHPTPTVNHHLTSTANNHPIPTVNHHLTSTANHHLTFTANHHLTFTANHHSASTVNHHPASTANHHPTPTANHLLTTASSGTRTATSVRVWLSSASNSPATVRSTSGGALVLPSGFDVTKLYPELSKLGVVKSTSSSSNGTTVLPSINSSSSSNNSNSNIMHAGDAAFSNPSEILGGRNRLISQSSASLRSTGTVVASSPSTVLLTSSSSSSTPTILGGTPTSSGPRLDTSGCTHAIVNATETLSFRTSTPASFPNATLTNSIISPVKVSQSSSNLVNFIKIGGSGAQVKGLVPVSGGDIRQARLLPDGRIIGIRATDAGSNRVPVVSAAARGLCNGVSFVNKNTMASLAGGHSATASTSIAVGSVRSGSGADVTAPLPCNTKVALPSVSTSATVQPVTVATPPFSNGTSELAGVLKHSGAVGKRAAVAAGMSTAAVAAAAASRSSVEEAELQARSKQLQLQKQLEQIHGGLSRAGSAASLVADVSASALPMTTVKQFRLSPKQMASLLSQATLSPTSLTVVSRASLLPPQSAACISSAGIKRKASPAAPARNCKSLKSSAPLAALHPSQGNSSHLSTNLVSNISTSSPSCASSSSSSASLLSRNGLSVLTRAKVSSILKTVADSSPTVTGSPLEPSSVAGSIPEHKSVLQQRRVSFKSVVGDRGQHHSTEKVPQDRRNYSRSKSSSSSTAVTKPGDVRVGAIPNCDTTTWATFAPVKAGSTAVSSGTAAGNNADAWTDAKQVLARGTAEEAKPAPGKGYVGDVKPVLSRKASGARCRVVRAQPDGEQQPRLPMSVRLPKPVQELHDLMLESTVVDAPCIVPHSLLDLDDSDTSRPPSRLRLRADPSSSESTMDDCGVRRARLSVAPQTNDGSNGCHTDALLTARVANIPHTKAPAPSNIPHTKTAGRLSAAVADSRHHSTVAAAMLTLCRKRHSSSVARTAALIKAARHSPSLTASTVAHFDPHLSLQGPRTPRRSHAAQRSCLLEKTTCAYELTSPAGGSAPCSIPGGPGGASPPLGVCGAPALPGTRHCMRHITYNVDQQIFVQCCARSDGTMCRVPVLCLADQPLCAAHRHCVSDDHTSRGTSPSSPSTAAPSSSAARKCRRKGKVPTSCRYGKRKRRRSTTPHSASATHSSGKGGGKGTGKGKGGGSGKVVPSTAVRPPMNNGPVLPSGGYHHLLPSSPPHSPFSVAACSECGDSATCCCPPKQEGADDLDGSLDASLELPGNVVAAASRLLDPQHLHDLLLEEEQQQQQDIFPLHCSVAPDVKVEGSGSCGAAPGMSTADVFSLGSQQQLPAMQQAGAQQLQQCAADAGLTAAALDSYASVMDATNPIDSMISSSFNQQELNVITQFLGNIVDQDVLMMQQQPSAVGSAAATLDGVGLDPIHTSCGNNPPLSFFDNALVGDACISQSLAGSVSSACPATQQPNDWNGTQFTASCTSSAYASAPLPTTAGLLDMYANGQTRKTSETGVVVSGACGSSELSESYARKVESSQFSMRVSEEFGHSGGLNVVHNGGLNVVHNGGLNVSAGDLCTSSAAPVGYSQCTMMQRQDNIFDSSGQVVTAPTSTAPVTCAPVFAPLGVPQYNTSSCAASLLASSDTTTTAPLTASDIEVPVLLRAASDVSASPAHADCLESNPGSFSQLPSPSMPPTPSDDDMTSVVEFPSPTASDPSLTDIDADIRRTPEHMDDCKRPLLYQPPDCRILPPGFRLIDAKAPAPRLH